MKHNYIKPEIEIIEADPVDFMCESGQIDEGLAKGGNNFYIDDFDDEEDWDDFGV